MKRGGLVAPLLLCLVATSCALTGCKFEPVGFQEARDSGTAAREPDSEAQRELDASPPDATEPGPDADETDVGAEVGDQGVLDALTPDGETADGTAPDAPVPDAPLSDAPGPTDARTDGGSPDARRDAGRADARPPPDTAISDREIPDAPMRLDAGPRDAAPRDAGAPDTGFVTFSYTPSNFDPAAFVPPGPALAITQPDCVLSASAMPSFNASCGDDPPTPIIALQPGGVEVVIVPTAELSVAASGALRVIGDHPVILAVYGSASISGQIIIDADHETPGPGARDWTSGCATGGGAATTGTGGGGGGGFGNHGGPGGNSGGGPSGRGGAEGHDFGEELLEPIAGGCGGGHSGAGTGSDVPGGAGGGAIQISAATVLSIADTGAISAAGGGGRGGPNRSGAGGGGSGGAILLEGAQTSIAAGAAIVTNGGGGGGGGSNNSGPGGRGADGDNGHALDANPAGGGAGAGRGGSGGIGGTAQDAQPGSMGAMMGGGGGGGGGSGRYRLRGAGAVQPRCTISPNAVLSGHGRRDC